MCDHPLPSRSDRPRDWQCSECSASLRQALRGDVSLEVAAWFGGEESSCGLPTLIDDDGEALGGVEPTWSELPEELPETLCVGWVSC